MRNRHCRQVAGWSGRQPGSTKYVLDLFACALLPRNDRREALSARLGLFTPNKNAPRAPMTDAQTTPNTAIVDKTTILVVDDEVLVRAMIGGALRDEGYAVLEAINADEAVAILRSSIKVDILLTDQRMPGSMDGAGLVRLVRAEFPFLKVLMIAGQVPESVTRELLDGYLSKPVTPWQVCDYVRAVTGVVVERGS